MVIDPSPDQESTVVAYRILNYEVGILKDQIALTVQYVATPEEAQLGKRRTFQLALPPEAAMRAAMGLLEATRSCLFDQDAAPESGAKH